LFDAAGVLAQLIPKQDKETVRWLLETALNKLDGETGDGYEGSSSIVVSESDNQGSPLILVLVGGLDSSTRAAPPERSSETGRLPTAEPSASAHSEAPAAHPGLERFPLAITDANPAATKACFMEPGRACVSSGACEMRGF
jgi:hypothetical protein